jgi:outer membrane protein assembly factor BamD
MNVTMNTFRELTLALLATLVLAACGARAPINPPADAPEPDRYLYEQGQAQLERKRWLTAREYFRRLVDGYPQSRFRADAKLGIGDSYLGENSAEGHVYAINEFREFLAFFPTHARADYAQYRMALSHYQQMRAPQRDQTATKDTIRELELFVERYPASQLRPEVDAKLREARDRLGRAEYEVGLQYFRMRWYPGALERFAVLLKRDPEFTHRDAVYYYMAETMCIIGQPAEALPMYDRILKEFERSDFLERARRKMAEIEKAPTTACAVATR